MPTICEVETTHGVFWLKRNFSTLCELKILIYPDVAGFPWFSVFSCSNHDNLDSHATFYLSPMGKNKRSRDGWQSTSLSSLQFFRLRHTDIPRYRHCTVHCLLGPKEEDTCHTLSTKSETNLNGLHHYISSSEHSRTNEKWGAFENYCTYCTYPQTCTHFRWRSWRARRHSLTLFVDLFSTAQRIINQIESNLRSKKTVSDVARPDGDRYDDMAGRPLIHLQEAALREANAKKKMLVLWWKWNESMDNNGYQ